MSEESPIRALAGRYRLITPLGTRVMRGWDLHLRQVVAIRLFARQDDPDEFVSRISALTGLAHPGLVRVLDAGVADEKPFVVQEFVAGTTLRARLAEGPLTAAEVTELGSALGKALAYAHSQGVAHRDVSPGNILLGPGMEPFLTNVGIAAQATPSYMSPEEADGREPGMASDVYSLGLVLLESLTGRVEYPGDDPTTALARLTRAPIVKPDLPHAATLMAMLSPDPNDRPDAATCVDMLRGSSAKSRVQTRTVLVAAVVAAVTATGIGLVLNIPQQEPRVEPRDARVDQPRQPVTAQSTPPSQVTPNVIEVPAATGQRVPQPPPPVRTTSSPPPPVQGQQVALVPPPINTTTAHYYWYPWEPPKPPKKPKHPKPPNPGHTTETEEDD